MAVDHCTYIKIDEKKDGKSSCKIDGDADTHCYIKVEKSVS